VSGATTISTVVADGTVVGRIFKANAAPAGSPSMWTLAFEAAMPSFAKSWRADNRGKEAAGVFSSMFSGGASHVPDY
jgi:hypothetical protein